MRARRTRKSLRSIVDLCEERFFDVQRSYRCLNTILLDVLKLNKLCINPTLGEELLVITLLDDATIIDYEDAVGIHNG